MRHDIPTIDLHQGKPRPFHIRPIMRRVDPAELAEPPHRHNFQELLWIRGGVGEHRIDDVDLTITPRTFYFVAQGQVHFFTRGEKLDGYLIRFTDDFLLNNSADLEWNYRTTLFSHFAVHHELQIDATALPIYEQLMDALYDEQQTDQFGRMTLQRHLLSIILLRLERERRASAPSQRPLSAEADRYQTFVDRLELDFKQQHQVAHYASALHVTPRQLSDSVRRYTGKNAKRLIIERQILEAKRYLQHTNASVKEVAHSLGFDDPSYFSKLFRQHAGVAPHAFKSDL